MSNSAILKSTVVKKYWMALTGIFLSLFIIGHLFGNLQLLHTGEEARKAFNEYGYFMTHNPIIEVLSILTYLSVLIHAVTGIAMAIKNKKARPIKYAYSKPGKYSSWPSRNMPLLGALILVFIIFHMQSFWFHYKVTANLNDGIEMMQGETFPLHKVVKDSETYYLTTDGKYETFDFENTYDLRNGTDVYLKGTDAKQASIQKDLYSLVYAYFGQDMTKNGFPTNGNAMIAILIYIIGLAALAFHLWHGVSSSVQSLGFRNKYNRSFLNIFGKSFAVIITVLFAIIPLFIYFI